MKLDNVASAALYGKSGKYVCLKADIFIILSPPLQRDEAEVDVVLRLNKLWHVTT
jgi:hypothetical protein